jgi:hypothetical protein
MKQSPDGRWLLASDAADSAMANNAPSKTQSCGPTSEISAFLERIFGLVP